MRPIEFKEQNVIIAKDQPEYQPLPAYIDKDAHGDVVSCWKLSLKERLIILFKGKLWVRMLCFHKPVTPITLTVDKSEIFE